MDAPFVGSEAVAAGALTPYQLRTRFRTIHRDVYIAQGTELTAPVRAHAAWLWSQRRGVVAGHSAAALHGAKWVDVNRPAELIYENRHAPPTIRTWSDRIEDDEATSFDAATVTSPARTALDLARRYPIGRAVPAIDALARATDLKMADVELLACRFDPGGCRRRVAPRKLVAADPSPRGVSRAADTDPRLRRIRPARRGTRYGWEHIKLAVEYDGDHHWTHRRQFNKDIARADTLTGLGWINVRVTAEDTEGGVIARVTAAWGRRA